MDPNGLIQHWAGQSWFFRETLWWTAFGLVGNALFASRFLVQWLYSEWHKRVIVPPIFWHLSFWGSVVSLVYAFHIDKLPVILGYLFLPIIYARNLRLLYRKPAAAAPGQNGIAESEN